MGKKLVAIILMFLILIVGLPMRAFSAEPAPEGEMEGYIYSSGAAPSGIIPFYINPSGSVPDYYVLENGKVYSVDRLPSPGAKGRLPIEREGRYLLVPEVSGNSLFVCKYKESKGNKQSFNYTLHKRDLVASATHTPVVTNMKRLKSGALLLVWYDQIWDDSKSYPRFSYLNKNKWRTTEAEWENLSSGAPWVTADFAQDNNGLIWYFGHHDSNKNMALIQLIETSKSVEVVSIDTDFITKGEEPFFVDGESPYIVCEAGNGCIILAYHSKYFKFFSTSPPYLKGSKINVVKVLQDKSKELICQTEDYAERITPFALIGTSIIYAPIDEGTLLDKDIYLLKENGDKSWLAKIKYSGLFRYTDTSYFYSYAGEIETVTLALR